MIRLILHHNNSVRAYLFTKSSIIIGEGEPNVVDISLNGLGFHQNHLRIYLKESYFYISNQANDPFITLNGAPFRKKKLKAKDTIQIKKTTILVEELVVSNAFIEELIGEKSAPLCDQNFESIQEEICDFPDAEILSKEEDLEGWFPSDLTDLQNENLKNLEEKKGVRNSHASDLNEEQEEVPKSEAKSSFFSLRKLKWFAISAVLMAVIASAVGIETYLRAASKSGIEEAKAAESLSDLSMALAYAKIFHITPPKQNFSDPEFLKSTLNTLLPSNSSSSGTIDTQGQFSNCSYLFRFYSEQDLSRFLIIAQPAPSLSQWLFPKDAILIDSSLMDLRKISDLKIINGLLASAKPFEGHNARELLETIKRLKVFPLNQLAKISKKREFAPPRIIKYLRPGAENLIYNAPRYFLFGAPLIKKLTQQDLSPLSQQSSLALTSELERYATFENLVFYTIEGLQVANKIHKTLVSIAPTNHFLTGCLLLSPTEEILTSRLVIEVEHNLLNPPAKGNLEVKEIAQLDRALVPQPFSYLISKKLESFRTASLETLMPLIRQMAEILEEGLQKGDPEIKTELYFLLDRYQTTKQEQKQKLQFLIQQMEVEHPQINNLELYQLLKNNQLENWFDFRVKSQQQLNLLIPSPLFQTTPSPSPPLSQSSCYKLDSGH
ncbi:hypothetical protein PHSC3_001957 [Chlamydiales bacterium STE3]|nr:hypothetical protein PHSC3_001957 [Chlamydiales bacterium STE3]